MSEELTKIFCSQCGGENAVGSKFCRSCGAKLEEIEVKTEEPVAAEQVSEQAVAAEQVSEESVAAVGGTVTEATFESTPESVAQEPITEASNAGVFSSEEFVPVYEKVTDAEVVPPVNVAPTEEIKINYAPENNSYSSTYSEQPQYYTQSAQNEKQTNGNIGFAIASMVCGILSLICCCFGLFSLVLAIVAIVLGIIAIACNYDGKGMAIAGIATGGVGIALWVVGLILSSTTWYTEWINDNLSDLY